MKASLFIVVLLLISLVNATRAEQVTACPLNFSATSATAYWPSVSLVNVYFVHDVFTSGERQTLWAAIAAWSETARKTGSDITFVDAGETGGLIDCAGCLTITRQGFDINRFRQRVSFNPLRQDQAGRLISAWIGFERAPASRQALSALMHQALGRGLAVGVAPSRATAAASMSALTSPPMRIAAPVK
jgi:hypothetical protein